jgi:hypothetical protein
MPLITDTTKSRKINSLRPMSEVIFYRLLMKVDGYDNFIADPQILKAELFPLKSYVRTIEISDALAELSERGLISIYEADDKPFLHLHNNRQKLPKRYAKWPQAPEAVLNKDKDNNNNKNKESEHPRALSELKKILLETGIAHFQKYFLKEKQQLDSAILKYENAEVPEADEKKLRAKYVHKPLMNEIEKFIHYYESRNHEWDLQKTASLFINWLNRKLHYEKE